LKREENGYQEKKKAYFLGKKSVIGKGFLVGERTA